MNPLFFPLGEEWNKTDRENIQNTLPYLSDSILNFKIHSQKLEVLLKNEGDSDSVEKLILEYLAKIKSVFDTSQTVILFDQTHIKPINKLDIFPELVRNREIFEYSKGIYSLHGRFHELYSAIDRISKKFALAQGALESTYPVSMPIELLQKSRFFSEYPHFANFISVLKENPSQMSELSQGSFSKSGFSEEKMKFLKPPRQICRSAGCLHIYPSYSGQKFIENSFQAITMSGRIFRNESLNAAGLERLNEFGMREIIYLGTEAAVKLKLKEATEWFIDFMKRFGLQGTIQSANDPFFADNLATLQFFQISRQTKQEVRFTNPGTGNSISVSSINFHGSHFSKAYDLKFSDGQFISTGCVGFGLERFVFTLLAQVGLDERIWPNGLKEFLANDH